LSKYLELYSNNAVAWNLLGLILEHQGLYERALDAYHNSSKLDKRANPNYARMLLSQHKFQEAIDVYSDCDQCPSVLIGTGISLFFNNQLEDSLKCLRKGLNSLNGKEKNDITLLFCQVLYAQKKEELSREMLLQCFNEDPEFLPAILCLCAIGLKSGDYDLTLGALQEITSIANVNDMDPECKVEYILFSLFHAQGDFKIASGFLSKAIHKHPTKSKLWCRLGEYISSRTISIVPKKLQRYGSTNFYSSLISSSLESGEYQTALKEAKKGLFLFPGKIESWAVFLICLRTFLGKKEISELKKGDIECMVQVLNFIKLNDSPKLKIWVEIASVELMHFNHRFYKNTSVDTSGLTKLIQTTDFPGAYMNLAQAVIKKIEKK
jgi:superkiller protein 3